MDNQPISNSSTLPPQYNPSVAPKLTPTDNLTPPQKSTPISLVIGLIVAIIFALGLGVLSVYLYMQYVDVATDLDSQIDAAVAVAVKENTEKLEDEFDEREKAPYKVFAGPTDYGELTFNYPKTWSVYIDKDASDRRDFHAYLNPSEVHPVSDKTINALRVSILNDSMDKVIKNYDSKIENKALKLTVVSVNGTSANRYEGRLTNDIEGIAVVMKIRDKTAIIQTDSMLFKEDFDTLIKSVKFNL